jgi:flagellin
MVIDNATGIALVSQIQKNQTGLKKYLEKLSTGKSINRASDDAALMSIARELEKQVRGFQQADNNLADAMSALRVADGAAGQITDIMQRQRELAIQANNGTMNQAARDAINTEFQQLSQEVDRIAKSSQFNTMGLLDGTSAMSDGSGQIQAGPNNTESDQIAMEAADLTSDTLNITNLNISNPQDIGPAIDQLDRAMEMVNNVRTAEGALYNRFQHAAANSQNAAIQTAFAQSQAEDLDYAQGIADQARASLLNQTSIQALGNFNEIARNNVMALLQ